jgi:hypothetical protein
MFLILLGASLTFGAGLLATAIYTEGALLALRTMRRASFGPICAASVTSCSGVAVLYMSYFFEWNEQPFPAIRHAAAAETFSLHPSPTPTRSLSR